HLLSSMLLAVHIQLGLCLECRLKALQRAEQRVALVERVCTRLGGMELEPERDLVRAVRDPQTDARLRRPTPPRAERRVLDEDPHVGATVEARQVELDLLVDTRAADARIARRVRAELGHRR